MVFHNGSSYDYNFIIKELAKKFEGEFNCLIKILKNTKPFQLQLQKMLKGLIKTEKNYKDHMLQITIC